MFKIYLVCYQYFEDDGEPYGDGMLGAYATKEAAIKAIKNQSYITLEQLPNTSQFHAIKEHPDMENSIVDVYYSILDMLVKE